MWTNNGYAQGWRRQYLAEERSWPDVPNRKVARAETPGSIADSDRWVRGTAGAECEKARAATCDPGLYQT